MPLIYKKGKIKHLRTSEQGWDIFGPPGNDIQVDAAIVLDSASNMGFGLTLKGGDEKLASHLAMLSLLRDAYIHQLDVTIAYDEVPGKTNYYIKRIMLER